MKIAIVLGSTRTGRRGADVADWVLRTAQGRRDAEYELVDLRDHPLPHFDEPESPITGRYASEHQRAWAAVVAHYDGFVFVSPEYNHSTSGVLKNALDHVYAEWNDKAAGFVAYGTLGGGRAVEQLRLIAAGVQMATVRQQVALSAWDDWTNLTEFTPRPQQDRALATLLDQLERWTRALQTVRQTVD